MIYHHCPESPSSSSVSLFLNDLLLFPESPSNKSVSLFLHDLPPAGILFRLR